MLRAPVEPYICARNGVFCMICIRVAQTFGHAAMLRCKMSSRETNVPNEPTQRSWGTQIKPIGPNSPKRPPYGPSWALIVRICLTGNHQIRDTSEPLRCLSVSREPCQATPNPEPLKALR